MANLLIKYAVTKVIYEMRSRESCSFCNTGKCSLMKVNFSGPYALVEI